MDRPVSEPQFEIQLNGAPRSIPHTCTLGALIETLDLGEKRIAIAVNRDVIPRSQFNAHQLADGDRVEILEAVGGG
ncbi:MAG: sulfur carrier protein ThiS [Deltaproteobacteria bacterium]|nr:sulfur carrier protein ThiS [Deltaproteobacteria bacterium]